MGQLHVEGWAPEYGSPYETDEALADSGKVDDTIEVDGPWSPIRGVDDGVGQIAFVDGVRRIDARLTLDEADGPVPGICGSYGVGAVVWDRDAVRSDFADLLVDRLAVFGNGCGAPIPPDTQIVYRSESIPETDPGMLIQRFHGAMRKAEARLSEKLAQGGQFVVADGPINDLSATEKVGYIKTHRAPYLSQQKSAIMGRVRAGERTPLFLIGQGGAYPRYSWYQRLVDSADGHSWSGVVRCEVSSALTLEHAQRIANRMAAVLQLVGSEAHIDPRAPQNLVPIAALERELRRRLGDPAFVYRALRSAVAGAAVEA
ncbi:MAG: hypothetical protein GY788_29745 [bacterium]|nr:hypothetical protein [bacterium]